MSYRTESLTRKKLEILKEMGIYKDEEEFIEEAINSLLEKWRSTVGSNPFQFIEGGRHMSI